MFTRNETKTSHALRLAIFVLRILVGLNFFYLGFSALFNPQLGLELSKKSMGGLYGWLHASRTPIVPHAVSEWMLLVIGVCLMIGFATRLAACAGIIFAVLSFLSNSALSSFHLPQFANNELVITACLLVIIFSKAGRYLGLDAFFHFSLRHKK